MARTTDSVGPLLIAGGVAAVGFLLAMGAWAGTMSVNSAAIARGHAIAEGNRKAVQARDSAPVRAVFVKEGDRVEVGQPLLELDLSDIRGEVAVYEATRWQLMARRARLEAERAGGPLAFPASLVAAAGANPQVQSFIDQERTLHQSRDLAHRGALALVDQKIAGAKDRIDGLNARLTATRRQLDYVVQERDSIAPLVNKGVIARSQLLALEREGARLQGEIEGILTEVAASTNEVAEGEGEKAQLDKQRAEEIAKDLAETEANLSTIEPRLMAANQRLGRAVITSPETGYVYELAVFSSGAAVLPGQTLLEIVPADQPLVLQVEIAPADIERVKPGQEASIHLIPYNRRYQSLIGGTLERISADMITDERTQRSYYHGIVSVDGADLTRAGAELLPGMPAEVMINAGDRTIAEYFLDPILRLSDQALKEQ